MNLFAQSCAMACAAVVVLTAVPASGQYFGRNKVQHKTLRFQVLATPHFDVYFYEQEREAAHMAARLAERWYARLAGTLGHDLEGRQPLILYASHPDFEQTNAVPVELGEAVGGVTESLKRRIVLPLAGPLAESDLVIGHELVHAFQYDIALQSGSWSANRSPGIERLPLWFVEGMAEYLCRGAVDAHTAMWMRDVAARETLPRIRDLNDAEHFPYRWGQALWAYVTGRWGDHVVSALLRSAAVTGDAIGTLERVTGLTSDELSAQWHQALRESAEAVRRRAQQPRDAGRLVAKGESEVAGLNVSPSISPDGQRVMFLSQRSLLAVDLYLADAATGRVAWRVTDTAVDPHFTSLGFVRSAGAWSPDGRRFAFAAVRGGRPVLVILDVDRKRTLQEVPFPGLGEIANPTWSPDGQSIAFSAILGGLTDLFVADLRTGRTARLTSDPFADLQPAWSPDGKSIALVTDRFSTRLPSLEIGNYQLAVVELATGAITAVPGGGDGKNIDPKWLSNTELLFVSDRGGVSNIFRADVGGGAASRVTNLATGVSGITPTSPAISYAGATRRVVFSVFEDATYSIYSAGLERSAGPDPAGAQASPDPAKLPPALRVSDRLVGLSAISADPAGQVTAKATPYRPRLLLDFASQPYVGVGVDSYGTFASGGVSLVWSDMLGNRSLGAAVQVSTGFGGIKDILRTSGAVFAYADTSRRWNWAFTGGQVPYLAGGFTIGTTGSNGGTVGQRETTLYRQLERSVTGTTAYPFSHVRRVELSTTFSQVSFDREVETILFDLSTGDVTGRRVESASLGRPLGLWAGSAALVSDTSTFGAASPVLGERYRLQVSPAAGSIRFTSVLADYRRYLMPAPFLTVAARALHYGRYGSGGQDPRLVPLYLGYPDLVRGYEFRSFGPEECTPSAASACPEFDRLLGSRMLVGNLELRFPLLRPLGVNRRMYGPVPVEVALFADAGVAWDRGEEPSLAGGRRRGVASAGGTLRANILGLAVAALHVAKPLDRPGRGWVWQFSVSPGF